MAWVEFLLAATPLSETIVSKGTQRSVIPVSVFSLAGRLSILRSGGNYIPVAGTGVMRIHQMPASTMPSTLFRQVTITVIILMMVLAVASISNHFLHTENRYNVP